MRNLFPLALILALAACEPHVAKNSGPTGTRAAPPASAAAAELNRYPFVCAAADCPAGVGVFTALTDLGYVTCTGFMVGDRTFVTNRHCLPESMKVRGTTCRGKAAVAFQDHGVTSVIDCKTVLDVSADERSLKPDFAYLELDRPRGGSLALSREGVGDDQALTAWAVTRVEGKNILAPMNCRSVLNSLLNPAAASAFSAVSLAVGCRAQPGNTGAPLLNPRGEVVGFIQTPAPGSSPAPRPPFVNFTNMACVSNPTNGAGAHPNCARVAAATVATCGAREVDTDRVRGDVIDQIAASLPPIFRYKITYDEFRRAVVAEPKCVVTIQQDVNAWIKYVRISKWFTPASIDVAYDAVTKLESAVETDEVWRIKPALKITRGEVWPQRYRLKYGRDWDGTVSRERTSGQSFNLAISLGVCASSAYEAGDERGFRTADGRELTATEWRQYLDVVQATKCAR